MSITFIGTIGVGTALAGGILTEPSDPAYSRQPISMVGTAGGAQSNKDIVAWRPLLGSWGTIAFLAIYNPAGTMVWSGPLTATVAPELAEQVAFLPGSILASNNTTLTSATLVPWAANPQRTIGLITPGVVVTAPTAGVPALAVRPPGAEVDDSIDVSSQVPPGDVVTSATMTSADPTMTVVWASFQVPSLISVRSTGGTQGTAYTYTLSWTTLAGLNGTTQLSQIVDQTSAGSPTDPQVTALAQWTQAELNQQAIALAQETATRAAAIASLGTTVATASSNAAAAETQAAAAVVAANTAETQATTAGTAAAAASTAASTAQNAANVAAGAASSASTVAAGANTAALAAEAQAAAAAAAASTASASAAAAASTASSAYTTAEAASASAATATTQAASASAAATTAEGQATSALTAATAAQTSAASAQASATTANTAATAASTLAGTANTAAIAAETQATSASTAAAAAAASATAAASEATSAYTAALNAAAQAATAAAQAAAAASASNTASTQAAAALLAATTASSAAASAGTQAAGASTSAAAALAAAQAASASAATSLASATAASAAAAAASASAVSAANVAAGAEATAVAALNTANQALAVSTAETARALAAESLLSASILANTTLLATHTQQIAYLSLNEQTDAANIVNNANAIAINSAAIAAALLVAQSAVPLAGAVMTGPLTLSGDPVAPLGAASRQFVLSTFGQTSSYAVTLGTPLGTWDATANSPTLGNGGAGGTINQGLVVINAGSTSLDGNATWNVGDVAYNTGLIWRRLLNPGGNGALTQLNLPKEVLFYDGVPDGTHKLIDKYGYIMAQFGAAGFQTTAIAGTNLTMSGYATVAGLLTSGSLNTGLVTATQLTLAERVEYSSGSGSIYSHVWTDKWGYIVGAIGNDGTVYFPGLTCRTTGVTVANLSLTSILINGTASGTPVFQVDPNAATVTIAVNRVMFTDPSSPYAYEQRDKWGYIMGAVGLDGTGYGTMSKGGGSGGGTTGPDAAYTTAMVQQRDAENVGLSNVWKNQRMARYLPLTANVIFFISDGQSLSAGWYGVPVLSTTQPYDSVMMGTSIRAVDTSTTATTFVPTGTPLPGATGPYPAYPLNLMVAEPSNSNAVSQGETPAESAINFLRRAYLQMHGKAADPTCIFLVANTGIGGRTIAQLSKGATPELFNRNRDAAHYALSSAAAAGLTCQFGGVIWTQGEDDVQDGTSYATYTAEFKQLQADMNSDVTLGIFGQTAPVPWFCHMPGSNGPGRVNDVYQALATMAATFGSDLYLGGPVYQYPDHSIHVTANGYRWHGNQVGKAMERVLLRQQNHRGCYVRRATYLGTSILLDVNVPEPPLQHGDSYSAYVLTLYTNLGLIVTDVFGTTTSQVPITAVTLYQSTIRIDLARTLNNTPLLTIGYTNGSGMDIGTNICDSDPALAIGLYTYTAGVQDAGENIGSWNGSPLIGTPYPLQNYLAIGDNIPIVADPYFT